MVERITEALTMFPTADADPNPIVERTVTVLKTLQKSVEDFPVTSRPVRFGSPQFREWHTHLSDNISTYLSHITSNAPLTSPPSSELPSSHLELRSHLLISFGHPTRLDYGTGHELSFLIFLILVLPPLSPPQLSSAINDIFSAYYGLTQTLQLTYNLEPAGSHGVWGLDDYYCLSYLFGSSLLCSTTSSPSDVLSESWREDNTSNLYVGRIRFVMELKSRAPFCEHSPMLHSLTGVESWEKVRGGMLKLWKGEVLDKFVVVQHLVFGETFKCTWHVEEQFRIKDNFVGDKFINREGGEISGSFFPPAGRAPWAVGGGPPVPVTRAPWADERKEEGKEEGGFEQTKAPWAK
ncbi:hypothetical protein TrST_g7340 [Triparma strigata]|uniref:Serine/threonine-protein phosphatase 2A activator n=1 Tax=Triparma strigata TaxID=1606541 RepID=A0A9W7BJ02_9STRA|nr:hypothetical protein TrST_g7340 [Triparma strigata]